MSNITAVVVDVISIQKYVYTSNRLKENIGASNIVTRIYGNSLEKSIRNVFKKSGLKMDISLTEWEKNPDIISIENPECEFEVGYIGGGNALLFFKEKQKAKEFINEWTRNLLEEAPGLNTAFAINDKFNINNFQTERDDLFKELESNKNNYFPQTVLPKHGITADCPYTGLSAEVFIELPDKQDKKGVYVSSVSYAKHMNADIDRQKRYVEELSADRYTCTDNMDKLGQTKGQNHIAIVNIDGNSMGKQFKNCKDLIETRKLSKGLKDIMQDVYKEFLNFIFENMDFFQGNNSGFKIEQDNKGKCIIPFRPILVEGDDITFITDGRLGIPFAVKYLELLSSKTLFNSKKLSACAGVAITKTKYPFFRGYSLAEELCKRAKNEARKNEGTSWIDFHVAYGGFSGTIEEIHKRKYSIQDGLLHFGPYLVSSADKNNDRNIFHLKEGIGTFLNKEKWPRSKVKEFREILTLGIETSRKFAVENNLKEKLYDFKDTGKEYNKNIWHDRFTPYFDMIELMDLFPKHFLTERSGE